MASPVIDVIPRLFAARPSLVLGLCVLWINVSMVFWFQMLAVAVGVFAVAGETKDERTIPIPTTPYTLESPLQVFTPNTSHHRPLPLFART